MTMPPKRTHRAIPSAGATASEQLEALRNARASGHTRDSAFAQIALRATSHQRATEDVQRRRMWVEEQQRLRAARARCEDHLRGLLCSVEQYVNETDDDDDNGIDVDSISGVTAKQLQSSSELRQRALECSSAVQKLCSSSTANDTKQRAGLKPPQPNRPSKNPQATRLMHELRALMASIQNDIEMYQSSAKRMGETGFGTRMLSKFATRTTATAVDVGHADADAMLDKYDSEDDGSVEGTESVLSSSAASFTTFGRSGEDDEQRAIDAADSAFAAAAQRSPAACQPLLSSYRAALDVEISALRRALAERSGAASTMSSTAEARSSTGTSRTLSLPPVPGAVALTGSSAVVSRGVDGTLRSTSASGGFIISKEYRSVSATSTAAQRVSPEEYEKVCLIVAAHRRAKRSGKRAVAGSHAAVTRDLLDRLHHVLPYATRATLQQLVSDAEADTNNRRARRHAIANFRREAAIITGSLSRALEAEYAAQKQQELKVLADAEEERDAHMKHELLEELRAARAYREKLESEEKEKELERQRAIDDIKRRKLAVEFEARLEALAQYSARKAQLEEEMERSKAEERELQEALVVERSKRNAVRVAVRQQAYDEKRAELRQRMEELALESAEKQRKLVEFFDAVASNLGVERSTTRATGSTTSSANRDDAATVNELAQRFQKISGYTTDAVMRDMRSRISEALASAGLQSSESGRSVLYGLFTVTPANAVSGDNPLKSSGW